MNPDQNVPFDLMIKRLEEANARAHAKFARVDEQVSVSEEDVARHSSDQQKQSAVPRRRSSRGGLALGLIGSLMATSFGVLALVWQSPYGDVAQRIVARWGLPVIQIKPHAPATDLASPELEQRLQAMSRDLEHLAQEIEQLKTSQEQTIHDNAAVVEQLKAALSQMSRDNAAVGVLKAALSQMTRDNAAVAEQLKATLSQMTRDNAAVVEQLKATQEQAVRASAARARR